MKVYVISRHWFDHETNYRTKDEYDESTDIMSAHGSLEGAEKEAKKLCEEAWNSGYFDNYDPEHYKVFSVHETLFPSYIHESRIKFTITELQLED